MPHVAKLLLMTGLLALTACTRVTDVGNLDSRGLAAAIAAANKTPGKDLIRLAPKGLYTLGSPSERGLLLPILHGEIEIDGRGAEIRGYSDAQLALLEVGPDAHATIRNLGLSEGSDGALRNYGSLKLDHVRITDSSASDTSAIVLNLGDLEARDSEIAYNTLTNPRRDAGTIVNFGGLHLRDTRIHDNLAQQGLPSLAVAGALLNWGKVDLDGASIDNNTANDEDSGVALSFPGILNLGAGQVEGSVSGNAVRYTAGDAVLAGTF